MSWSFFQLITFKIMEEKELIKLCLEGNRESLEKLVNSVQGLVFNLSLRFLWNRMDAEDATQEILVKLITNLSKYNGRSKFSTWAYRVAVNYLLNLKQTPLEKSFTSFDVFAEDLATTKTAVEYSQPDSSILEKEMKTGCTMAMLQCLNRDLRIAFILGSVLKIKSTTAATIAETTPENFRKRLEKARKLIGAFLNDNCGVYNPKNSCRCSKRVNVALSNGRIVKGNLNFADKIEEYNEEMEELNSLEGIYNNHGKLKTTTDFNAQIARLIAGTKIISAV